MEPTLVVLAAGMGSRYGGIKQISAVGRNDECLLDFATYDARECGFGKVVYVIRRDIEKDFRERLFDRVARNFDAEYVFQEHGSLLSVEEDEASRSRTKPWGTIHAVLCAEGSIKTPFAVINSDDYYGRDAFRTLGSYLSSLDEGCTDHAMVGYVLGNTMSRNGSVSRGVCTVRDGFLESITENTKISYKGSSVVSEIGDREVELSGSEWVSMNLFGFNLNSFRTFHEYWEAFKRGNLRSPKAEALLPEAAGKIVSDGKGRIKFFTSTEKWFGMTYPEDRETVRSEIGAKIDSGYYPPVLWSK